MKRIIYLNDSGRTVADRILSVSSDFEAVSYKDFDMARFQECESIVFIGALGVCVRSIAPYISDKYSDPAVVCIDSLGHNVISVLSGHVGGANALCLQLARALGANPVVTTQSDMARIWQLDTLAPRFGWIADASHEEMNRAIATLVNGRPVGLLLDVRDEGTRWLESTLPPNVRIICDCNEMPEAELIISVSPFIHNCHTPLLSFRPKVLNLGFGCRRDCNPDGIYNHIAESMIRFGVSPLSVKSVATIPLKKDERAVAHLVNAFGLNECDVYTADDLKGIDVPNPSEKVSEVTGIPGVAESCALKSADGGRLIIEKQKCKLNDGSDFTFAVAIDADAEREGHIEIVGAGPGDPELISVRGKRFLQQADLILYAGSLVPVELTHYAKPGCTVRSSAPMNLAEQFALMKEFYDRGALVVRLHTGDPCIYGAIQEQMAFFDRHGMSYHITPGISSFQAAAAALRSQFTIPEKVQTIILTRGEEHTPMPEREQLHKLAQSRSTMCIYLSAAIVDDVQRELLMAYPPETPVAACYKLTWKEERIYRGVLADLARIVHDNRLSLTTLLVVGDAIDNRKGLSRLYDHNFKHLFRK